MSNFEENFFSRNFYEFFKKNIFEYLIAQSYFFNRIFNSTTLIKKIRILSNNYVKIFSKNKTHGQSIRKDLAQVIFYVSKTGNFQKKECSGLWVFL